MYGTCPWERLWSINVAHQYIISKAYMSTTTPTYGTGYGRRM